MGVEHYVVDSRSAGCHEAVPEGDTAEGVVEGDNCVGGGEVGVDFADGAPGVVVVLFYEGYVQAAGGGEGFVDGLDGCYGWVGGVAGGEGGDGSLCDVTVGVGGGPVYGAFAAGVVEAVLGAGCWGVVLASYTRRFCVDDNIPP